MPGVPGVATHIPKRTSERRRRNTENAAETVRVNGLVAVPDLPERTHALARGWYESLKDSGQARFYEPSDWHAALVVAEMLTRLLSKEQTSAVLFAAVWSAMGELLSTEGSRRRLRLEIERQPVAGEKPENVTDYRARLTKGGRRVG